jgi:hypothetical protein
LIKLLATTEKNDADPPKASSTFPCGVSIESKATEPTTSNDIQNIPDHIHNTSIDGDGRISTTFYDAASYDDPQTSTINGGSPDLITWAQTFDGGNPSSEFN